MSFHGATVKINTGDIREALAATQPTTLWASPRSGYVCLQT